MLDVKPEVTPTNICKIRALKVPIVPCFGLAALRAKELLIEPCSFLFCPQKISIIRVCIQLFSTPCFELKETDMFKSIEEGIKMVCSPKGPQISSFCSWLLYVSEGFIWPIQLFCKNRGLWLFWLFWLSLFGRAKDKFLPCPSDSFAISTKAGELTKWVHTICFLLILAKAQAGIEPASKTAAPPTTTSVSPVLYLDVALCRGRLHEHPVRLF